MKSLTEETFTVYGFTVYGQSKNAENAAGGRLNYF